MAIIPKKVKLDAGHDTLAIEWQDGHLSTYGYEVLRDHCPCATCTGAEGGTPRTKTAPSALPMFKKAVRPLRAEVAGRYALQIFWSDGHSTGIYEFTYLRDLCPCNECQAARKDERGFAGDLNR
ncbi:MAG: gamma-butyrobetaine hydroxylase-like domain-containing protein [Terriglobia bacterium]